METFNNFYKIINSFFIYSISRDCTQACNGIISLFGEISEFILSKDLRLEWIDKIKEIYEKNSFTTYAHMNEKVLKNVFSEYFEFLHTCIRLDKINTYKEILNSLKFLIFSSITKIGFDIYNYIRILHIRHIDEVIQTNNCDLIKHFIMNLKDIGQYAFDNNNQDLSLHIGNMYNFILSKYSNIEIADILNEYKYKATLRAIYFNDDLAVLFIPDYSSMINNLSIPEKLDSLIDEYEDIIGRALYRNSTNFIFYILDDLNNIIVSFDKSKRKEQEKFFDLYQRLYTTCINTKSSENFYNIDSHYRNLLAKLDKDDNVSENLGLKIINIYQQISTWCIVLKQIDFCTSLIAKIAEMPKELNFIYRKKQLYSSIIDTLFQICLDAVENNLDDIIRNVSNRLGWMAMYAIENHISDIFNQIIEKVTEMINICIDFKINEKTIVFIGTLFIIIGGHTCSKNNIPYMNTVITNIRKVKQKDFLIKSKLIREHQSKTWNEFMNDNAKHYIDKFYNAIK